MRVVWDSELGSVTVPKDQKYWKYNSLNPECSSQNPRTCYALSPKSQKTWCPRARALKNKNIAVWAVCESIPINMLISFLFLKPVSLQHAEPNTLTPKASILQNPKRRTLNHEPGALNPKSIDDLAAAGVGSAWEAHAHRRWLIRWHEGRLGQEVLPLAAWFDTGS